MTLLSRIHAISTCNPTATPNTIDLGFIHRPQTQPLKSKLKDGRTRQRIVGPSSYISKSVLKKADVECSGRTATATQVVQLDGGLMI